MLDELKRLHEAAGEGVARIAAERIRHKSVEGWTPEHDAQHEFGELSVAAACYAVNAIRSPYRIHYQIVESSSLLYDSSGEQVGDAWPWHPDWDKREKHDRERSLEIAGALIAAELDRLASLKAVGK